MSFSKRWKFGWCGFAFATLVSGWASASGQAVPSGTKTAGLSIFGGASLVKPDYGTSNDLGFVVGGSYSRIFRPITISLEPRYGWTSGDIVTQSYFMLNLKVERAFGRRGNLHPFAEGGAGRGSMHLGAPYETTQVSSPSESIDGGLDYDLSSHLGIKVEYQYQFWDFGYASNGINPNGPSLSLYYRIDHLPFHSRR